MYIVSRKYIHCGDGCDPVSTYSTSFP